MNAAIKCALVACGLFLWATAHAQAASDDEASVLLRISEIWEAAQKGDGKWVDEMLAANFMGWNKSSPAPRSRSSVRGWNRVVQQMDRMVYHEIYPLSVTLHGDVAVAHYLYTAASKDKDGKLTIENGRYTDILQRTDDGWKFIAWHGGGDD